MGKAQAVYYPIVWQLVSVKAIVISAAHEYFTRERLQLSLQINILFILFIVLPR